MKKEIKSRWKRVFLGSGILFFLLINFSCTNDAKQEKTDSPEMEEVKPISVDSLPEGKWNGEYIKIENDEEKKKRKRSRGGQFYSMGKTKFSIGSAEFDIKTYDKNGMSLTFTTRSITAHIKDANDDRMRIKLFKEGIIKNHVGSYPADATEEKIPSASIEISPHDSEKKYVFQEGKIEVTEFVPQRGLLKLTVNGKFQVDGELQDGKGQIDLNFEEAIMTAQ